MGMRGDAPFQFMARTHPFCKPQSACSSHGGVRFVKAAQG